jgi:hypothetical protein
VKGDLIIQTACGGEVSVGESFDGSALHLGIGGQDARLTMTGVAELHRALGQWLLENTWVDDIYVGPLDDHNHPVVAHPSEWAVAS